MAPSPAVTAVSPSVLVIERLAEVVTVSVSLAVLLPVSGSVVLLLTVAVLVWSPVVPAGTV